MRVRLSRGQFVVGRNIRAPYILCKYIQTHTHRHLVSAKVLACLSIGGGHQRFYTFRARERETKKERKSAKKKESKKAEVPSTKKKLNLRFFLSPTQEAWFQSPKPPGGKAGVFRKMYSTYSMLNIIITFHNQRQRGRGREETMGKRQRGESEG